MRKSGRLASIHEDDPSSDPKASEPTGNTKKFTPTIPAVRRKKVVEEEQPVETTLSSSKPNGNHSNPRGHTGPGSSRKPLHTPAPVNVSGPLALGPASMPRSSSRSSANSGGSGILSARSLTRLNSSSNGSQSSSKPLSDSVPIEEEFSVEAAQIEDLLKPVVLLDSKINDDTRDELTHFEPESGKLFLFQMPPVLPSLLNHTQSEPSSSDSSAEKWPTTAQGHYGKLRRYKSGRLVMILDNGVEFVLNSSIESASEAQNTSILTIDPEFGQSFNLGSVQAKLVAVPEFEKFKTE